METRNILKEIYTKSITSKDADAIYEDAFRRYHKNKLKTPPNIFLELSATEWTAYAFHGISLELVAKWRYEGWPNVCAICNQSLDLEKERWWSFDDLLLDTILKKEIITHLDCYNKI